MGLYELIGSPGVATVVIALLAILGLLSFLEFFLKRRAPLVQPQRRPEARVSAPPRARRGGRTGQDSDLWAIYHAHKERAKRVPGYRVSDDSPEAMSVRLVQICSMLHYQEAFDFFTNYLCRDGLEKKVRDLEALGLPDLVEIVRDAKPVLEEFEKLDEILDFEAPEYQPARNGLRDLMRRFEEADGRRRIHEAAGAYFGNRYQWEDESK